MNSLLAGGAAALFAATAQAQVVINEISYDDMAGDSVEFVELYNAGAAAVDISGWTLSRGATAVSASYTAPASSSIAAGGYFLVGVGGTSSSGITAQIDGSMPSPYANSQGFITLSNSGGIVDSVVYGRGSATAILAGHGEPAYTAAAAGGGIRAYIITSEFRNGDGQGLSTGGDPNSSLTFQRDPNPLYLDTNDNERDFQLAVATPRAANFSNGTVTPAQVAAGLTMDFNGPENAAETRLPGLYSSFIVQSPTVADTMPPITTYGSYNPAAIPAAPAPGGGGVGMCWSTVNTTSNGFGNCAILNLTAPVADVEAEALVYVGAALSGAQYDVGDYFVLRGRPDPGHFFGDDPVSPTKPNGDVGVRLRFENNVGGSGQVNVFVEQRIDGVTVVFAGPVAVSTPGWHRMLLSVKGTQVAAIIGGAYGAVVGDGTLAGGMRLPADSGAFYTTTVTRPGGVGMNYHTKMSPASYAPIRPLTFDQLTFRAPTVTASAVNDWNLY